MFDPGDCALGNVRIDRDLRRRRNDNGNNDAGDDGIVRNVDYPRDAGNVRIVGNVRFRLEQHCFILNANVAHNSGRRCSNGNSVGIYRDRQSWRQLRSNRTHNERSAHCRYRWTDSVGTSHAGGCISVSCSVFYDKPVPVPNRRRRNVERLLK